MKIKGEVSLQELKKFGFLVGGIFLFIFGLGIPLAKHGSVSLPFVGIGSLLILLAQFRVQFLTPIYKAWMVIGSALGWLNSRIILSFIFFVILLPIGLTRRFSKSDPLVKKKKLRESTYRVPSREISQMERTF